MDRKKVIIFGTAKRGSEVLAILSQLPQYEAAAFSCNDEALWGMEKGRTKNLRYYENK